MFNTKKTQIQQQEQITISAYEMEVIQKSFRNTLRWLEHYIDKSGDKSDYIDNWQKQIPEPIMRQDLNDQPDEIKAFMETALMALDGVIEDKPDFILENLQEQFYSWLDKSGIRADNCPKELVECLMNINKVLTRDGKEFVERVDREASEDIAKMTPEERREKFYKTFTLAQKLMPGAETRKQSLEGKTYEDVEKNQFSGDSDQGKKLFGQIESGSASYVSVDLDKVVEKVKSNPQNWRLDEITTKKSSGFGFFSNIVEKKEWLIILEGAREDDFDSEGKLNFNNNSLYRWESFNAWQRFEIKQVKGLLGGYSTEEEIKWIVKEVKENPRTWRIGTFKGHNCLIHNLAQGSDREIGTLIHNQQNFSEEEWAEIERAKLIDDIKQNNTRLEVNVVVYNPKNSKYYEADDWFVHNEWKNTNEAGCLIFNSNTMIRAKDLREAEKQEIEASLQESRSEDVVMEEAQNQNQQQRQENSSQVFQPNQKNNSGHAGLIITLIVGSTLLVGSVVVMRKLLNRKVKK